MTKRIFFSLLAVSLFAAAAPAAQWTIDTTHSTVSFKVRHFFAKQVGEFTDFDGVIQFDPEQPEQASVEATIQVASVDTDNERRDGHLKSADFFDVENHPTITFKSTKVVKQDDGLVAHGDLTIRGITKPVSFPIEFHGAGPDPWGNQRAGFSAELTIDRKDYDVLWNNTLDQGGTVVGDEVAILLEIEAVSANDAEPGR